MHRVFCANSGHSLGTYYVSHFDCFQFCVLPKNSFSSKSLKITCEGIHFGKWTLL